MTTPMTPERLAEIKRIAERPGQADGVADVLVIARLVPELIAEVERLKGIHALLAAPALPPDWRENNYAWADWLQDYAAWHSGNRKAALGATITPEE